MPVVFRHGAFRHGAFRFHFFSNEGDPREPVHIHVTRAPDTAKFWLWPDVNVAYNKGFTARDLAQLSAIILERREEIDGVWHDYFA